MARYVAFLGSVNVGGNRLSMAELRHELEREEFDNVETVVASGNVLLDHDDRPTDGLAEKIRYILLDRFDIDGMVAVRSRDELAAAIAENPFAADGEETKVHTMFLAGQPEPEAFADLVAAYDGRGPERIAPGTRAVHIDWCEGVGKRRLTGPFIERRLGMGGTARNLRSMRRVLAKMDA
ncbi:DUF1697 domain-containing protein [Croceicoccus hydrothermalis]|uniref:DUF1697 domain-containing protein n=1 Tax=Croceicoccus hydrothermalis TaxID=2867964 RepID=UPI001EFBE2A4|nr:DUF1697 domain-containing protein [Croceicoccus hydrothermalis]